MKRESKSTLPPRNHGLPSLSDVQTYWEIRNKLLNLFEYRFLTPKQYREFCEENNLDELIPKVLGWVRGLCHNCYAPIKRTEKLNWVFERFKNGEDVIDLSKCESTLPNQRCYLIGIRCRDVVTGSSGNKKAGDTPKPIRCRSLPNPNWESLLNDRWHFINNYLALQETGSKRPFCSERCRIEFNNKKYNRGPEKEARQHRWYRRVIEKEIELERNTVGSLPKKHMS
jgi:hypothetical protein